MRSSSIGALAPRPAWLGSRRGNRWAGVAGALVGISLLVCGGARADRPTLITQADLSAGTYTISTPGRYMFAGNLSFSVSGGTAIQINSGNVDLNGAGYTLNGGSTSSIGIFVSSVSGVRIQNVDVTGFLAAGITVGGSSNTLVSSTASGNGIGIDASGSNNTVLGNTASYNAGQGIEVFGSNHVVTGNTTDHNGDNGIRLQANATDNLVRGNSASSNENVGIRARPGSAGNLIQGNTALSNGTFDLRDSNDNCNANTWVGNRFGSALPGCIR